MISKKIWLSVYALLLVSCSLLPVVPALEQNPTPTRAAAIATPTLFPTETELPTPTATATNLPSPTVTNTPVPTKTLTPSPTATVFLPKYMLQKGSPAYQRSWVHAGLGCAWIGVAGQVFGSDGKPLTDVVVVVEGELGGQTLDLLGVTGATIAYGPGGYEVMLAGQPLSSSGTLSLRLYGLDGSPQSNPVPFDTYADCGRNLIVFNWVAR